MKKMKHVVARALHDTPGFSANISFRMTTGKACVENPERWQERSFSEILKEAIQDPVQLQRIVSDVRFQAPAEVLSEWSDGQSLPSPTIQTYIWWEIIAHETAK